MAHLHIQSDNPEVQLTLFRVDGSFTGTGSAFGYGPSGPTFGVVSVDGVASSAVCTAPCDSDVDGSTGAEFFPRRRRPLRVVSIPTARHGGPGENGGLPGSRAVRVGGVVATTIGVSGVLLGALALGVSANKNTPSGFGAFGGVTLSLGGLMTILGIPMIRAGRTTFSFDESGGAVQF